MNERNACIDCKFCLKFDHPLLDYDSWLCKHPHAELEFFSPVTGHHTSHENCESRRGMKKLTSRINVPIDFCPDFEGESNA